MFPAGLDHPRTQALLAQRIAAARPRDPVAADAAEIPENPTGRAA